MNDRPPSTTVTGFELIGTAGPDERPPAEGWVPALVPGGVHESLHAAGRIPHPFHADGELTTAWVEERTWWYRATLDVPDAAPGERTLLRFDGLDGVATIWLDGEELGTHANQHRPATFDRTASAGPGRALLVRFVPPLGALEPDALERGLDQLVAMSERLRPGAPLPPRDALALRLQRVRRRKAACSWGWDFALRLPSIGLHRPVVLERRGPDRIAGVHVRTTALAEDRSTATVAIDVELESRPGCAVRVALTAPDGAVVHAAELAAADRLATVVEVADPQLWWSHDLGDQPLYGCAVELVRDGVVVDRQDHRIGIRTVELDRGVDPEGDGHLFRFLLNGVPTFARGANWVPASQLPGSVTEERLVRLVVLAVHAEMNMLRMWGGGIYEPHAFYDACDELGVLVWQDLMFACDDYPSDDVALTEEVRLESTFQVRRLRNHACLALWCGNNEIQAIHEIVTGSSDPVGDWGWSWFHELLPAVVAAESPGAIYWPGSPWGDDPEELINGVREGDRHAWEVWHGNDVGAGPGDGGDDPAQNLHFRRYLHDTGRFISEFGIHASPELATLERWTEPGTLALPSEALDRRNKDTPSTKGWMLMGLETGEPTTLPELVDRSMACQAEGLKLGIEHYRRRQPRCSGTLVWQLNDAWPGLSWSVIDFDLVAKAGYWFLQRAYRPVLASFVEVGDDVELWVTSSAAEPVDLELDVAVAAFGGPVDLRTTVAVTAAPHSSVPVWRGPRPSSDRYLAVADAHGRIAANRLFLAPLRDLPLDGSVEATVRAAGPGAAEVALTATGYAYLARVHADDVPGARFDTNYLDLPDGASAVIRVTGLPEGFDLGRLTVASYGRAPRPVALAG